MAPNRWEWPIAPSEPHYRERIALIREIPYQTASAVEREVVNQKKEGWCRGKALSLNISSGGILLLMGRAPLLEELLSLEVPTPVHRATTAILAEVRWVRTVPFPRHQDLHFVGAKFLL